ncbi:MAG TPA: ATP-binding protein [Steroidobacteraceae bacterium]|nr:ATP-binding protein [Steroidobacteraceae bacterium]
MSAWFRFNDWPLRARIVALLVAASLVPLGIATWISVSNARTDLYQNTARLLQARAEMMARRIDALNDDHVRIARVLAISSPAAIEQLAGPQQDAARTRDVLHAQLDRLATVDRNISAMSLLDATGRVLVSNEPTLEGQDLSRFGFIRDALAGEGSISDVFLSSIGGEELATLAYIAPVRAPDGQVSGLAAVWVDAAYLGDVLRGMNEKAGPGSIATVVDSHGIRIAHSSNPGAVFHPIQSLSPQAIEELEQEQRFGSRTRSLAEDVLGGVWEPQVDYRELPAAGMFRGPVQGGRWGNAIAQHCSTAQWTVFYMVPEDVLLDDVAAMVRSKLLFGAAIMVLAMAAGLLFASAILRPLRQLSAGADAIGAGNLDARVAVRGRHELAALGRTFNAMAERLRGQTEALKRESADQYRKLFQAMTDGFCTIEMIFDAQGHAVDFVYLEANREFETQTGFHDCAGRRKSEVVPDLEQRWLDIYGRVARTGEPTEWDEAMGPDGRHYHVRAYRVGGADSRRVAVLFGDITERQQAKMRQQAQLESLNLLHQITRAIGERQDLPSIFQVVLRSVEDQLPVDFACILLGEPTDARLRVEHIGEDSAPVAARMGLEEGGYIDIDANGLARCMGGQLVHEPEIGTVPFPFPQRIASAGLRSLVAAPLQVESRVFGMLVAARLQREFTSGECEFLMQLSEHVALAAHHAQLYAALQKAYEDLRGTQQAAMQQERLRALGQMASGIAHDINNAISPVSLYTDALLEREDKLTGQGRSQLETIQRAIRDVAATVARMREFYRDREPQSAQAPVQLNELVTQVVELTRARWSTIPQQRGITIEQRSELEADLPTVLGAANEIREALTNLVFNAVDAMPAGGVLTLRTHAVAPGQVLLEVRDTGIGMDEDSRRRCMEPFFTTKGERGTGLGLAMVYGMAQRHGADIQIESAPGQGTRVRLLFRATDSVPAAATQTTPRLARGLSILLIDDDPVLLRTLREILEGDGHMVQAAAGGREGITLAREALERGQHIDIVITDLGMPHVDGRQVAREIRAMAPHMPLCMLTGWGERLLSEGNAPPEVDLVLSKPPRIGTLREALARLCNTSPAD